MKYSMTVSILLLYSIGTLAVPVTMIQYNSQSPLECDGCKWIVSKAQDYLKNNEARLDNITEVAVESNICNHLLPKDIDLCDKLVFRKSRKNAYNYRCMFKVISYVL